MSIFPAYGYVYGEAKPGLITGLYCKPFFAGTGEVLNFFQNTYPWWIFWYWLCVVKMLSKSPVPNINYKTIIYYSVYRPVMSQPSMCLWSPRINTSQPINFTLLQNSIKVDIWKINQQVDWVVSYFTMSWFELNESIYRLLAIIIDTRNLNFKSADRIFYTFYCSYIFCTSNYRYTNTWISLDIYSMKRAHKPYL